MPFHSGSCGGYWWAFASTLGPLAHTPLCYCWVILDLTFFLDIGLWVSVPNFDILAWIVSRTTLSSSVTWRTLSVSEHIYGGHKSSLMGVQETRRTGSPLTSWISLGDPKEHTRHGQCKYFAVNKLWCPCPSYQWQGRARQVLKSCSSALCSLSLSLSALDCP